MNKNLVFCFDGTSNEPSDSAEDAISNVLKLHLLFGGDLRDGNSHKLDQLSLYYPGVGTYGSTLKRIFNAGLALTDVGRIIDAALEDLEKHYQSGDRIFVFGFSRGAAIARRFCSVVSKTPGHKQRRIAFVGVFDTVASIGMPDLNTDTRPATDVIFEDRHIASNIKQALHLVSIDDKRKAFQPTLMNAEERVTEVWFAGAHSDVGGSYRRDGLSDTALRFMLDELQRRKLRLLTLAPTEIGFDAINANNDDVQLDLDDVAIEPNVFGVNHEQDRVWPISEFTLYNRRVCVVADDKISTQLPRLHHSVAERIYGDRDYRPPGLKGVQHEVLYTDNTRNIFDSLAHHIRVGMRNLDPLAVGESRTVPVYAHQYYNRTGLVLEKGASYRFKVLSRQEWKDGGIVCGAAGWNRDHPDITWLKDLAVHSMEPFRRMPQGDWFALVGSVGDDEKDCFVIGADAVTYTPRRSDEFCPFANDLKRMYHNNDGFILLKVSRTA